MRAKRDFKGKVAVITGAAGGMGQALSRRFGMAGAKLAVTDLDAGAVMEFSRALSEEGIKSVGIGLDVTDESACRRTMDEIKKRFGRIDLLINNAGITHRSAFVKTNPAVYRRVMDVNYFGPLYCTKAAFDSLLENRGLIIVISSIAGFAPLLGRTGYSASKHALHGLFDSLRAEVKESGVGITLVCPGFTATNIEQNALGGDGCPTTHPQSKVGRSATPESVAEAVYLAACKDKRLLVLSTVGRLTRLMTRSFPFLYEWLMARSLRSELER